MKTDGLVLHAVMHQPAGGQVIVETFPDQATQAVHALLVSGRALDFVPKDEAYEKLVADAEAYRAYQAIVKVTTEDDTLHLSMRLNHRGFYVTRDRVYPGMEAIRGDGRWVGYGAEKFAKEMYEVINRVADDKTKDMFGDEGETE